MVGPVTQFYGSMVVECPDDTVSTVAQSSLPLVADHDVSVGCPPTIFSGSDTLPTDEQLRKSPRLEHPHVPPRLVVDYGDSDEDWVSDDDLGGGSR